MNLKHYIRDIPDFPKKGIMFKDITPLLQMPLAFEEVIARMANMWSRRIDAITGLDARGFIFASALAFSLKLPLVPIRKKGKLPYETISQEYGLEYGNDVLEIHKDAFCAGDRVLIVDDLLATGGTAHAASALIEKLGASVAGCAFVIEISGIGGREVLKAYDIQSLIVYR
jgi:adenine phosphoribosyltransferase